MEGIMSEEDHTLLKINCPEMVKRIDMEGGFISQLVARDGLTEDQKQIIMEERGQNRQADKLVDTLMRNGTEHTVDKMYYSLKDSGQVHIANHFLRQPKTEDHSWNTAAVPALPNISVPSNAASAMAGTDIPMTEEHKDRLDDHRHTFQGSLDARLTVDKLRSKRLLSKKDGDQILAGRTQADQVGAILDALQMMDDDAYTTFCTILRASKKGFLAKLLE